MTAAFPLVLAFSSKTQSSDVQGAGVELGLYLPLQMCCPLYWWFELVFSASEAGFALASCSRILVRALWIS